MASPEAVVEAANLRIRYGMFEAVRGIDLRIMRGEVFALLGPNGAGKTSTIEVFEGYRQRTGGDVTVLGRDPEHAGPRWRARIGVVLQDSEPERDLTVAECLGLYAGYYANPRDPAETLKLVGLTDQAGARAARLSGGQRRRLDVALALIGNPELLFLDEPTTGFDPSARRAAWEMVRALRQSGVTIVLTTHYLDEAEHLADRVAVIDGGKLVAEGTPGSLGGRNRDVAEVRFSLPPPWQPTDLPKPADTAVAQYDGNRVLLRVECILAVLGPLVHWAEQVGVDLADLEVRRPSLEDIYLALTTAVPGGA